jgi:hypothetical protein
MTEPAPMMRDQRVVDADHLRLISIFHFVGAGFAVLGIGFLGLHYLFLHAVLSNQDVWRNQRGAMPHPEQFFAIFKWFYVVFGVLFLMSAVANLLSGLFILRRKYRAFSLVVACLNLIHIPLGTILGVFTLVVLLRPSVREVYEARRPTGPDGLAPHVS